MTVIHKKYLESILREHLNKLKKYVLGVLFIFVTYVVLSISFMWLHIPVILIILFVLLSAIGIYLLWQIVKSIQLIKELKEKIDQL